MRAVAGHSRRARARLLTGQRVPGAGDHQRRQREHRRDGHGLRAADPPDARRRSISCRPSTRPRRPSISVEPRVWYNPELRSALFLVPGLIAYIGMISAVISTALSVVREKERGTMEQVRMAPLGTLSLHRRQDAAVLLHLDVLVARRSSWRRWCCSACR